MVRFQVTTVVHTKAGSFQFPPPQTSEPDYNLTASFNYFLKWFGWAALLSCQVAHIKLAKVKEREISNLWTKDMKSIDFGWDQLPMTLHLLFWDFKKAVC